MNIILNNGITNAQLKNNSANIIFKAAKSNAVYRKSAIEIERFISNSKEQLNGYDKSTIATGLCDMVGKCLGDKLLFQLVGQIKAPTLWLAINKNTTKAMEVIEEVLKAEENQGKTYNEIVDKMITKMKSQKQKTENVSETIKSTAEQQIACKKGRNESNDDTGKLIKKAKTGTSLSEEQVIQKIQDMPTNLLERKSAFLKYCERFRLTPNIARTINEKLKTWEKLHN